MPSIMAVEKFAAIDLSETFFDTLKADYPGFEAWYLRKAKESAEAYVTRNKEGLIDGFLYLKQETGVIDDVTPALLPANRVKVGTFKIDARGTRMGERFLKKVFDRAIDISADEIYVTVFAKHEGLTRLFDRYGFERIAEKPAANGDAELVMVRKMRETPGDIELDYPFIHSANAHKYLMSIYPKWHTRLFPDSKLNSEDFDIVQDTSYTNSIHKVYLCRMAVEALVPGDLIVMYRTKDKNSTISAEYASVATSIVVVEELRLSSSFDSEDDFLKYCLPFSVFKNIELQGFYRQRSPCWVIKFTYNAAFAKRIIRKRLIEEVGMSRSAYWGFMPLSDQEFAKIIDLGGVNADLIVD